jgi:hypothetical protein
MPVWFRRQKFARSSWWYYWQYGNEKYVYNSIVSNGKMRVLLNDISVMDATQYGSVLVVIKSSLCLINYAPRHEDVWVSGGTASQYLILALDRCQWSASRPGRFNLGQRARDTHWRGGWVGPTAGLDVVKKRSNETLLVDTGCKWKL